MYKALASRVLFFLSHYSQYFLYFNVIVFYTKYCNQCKYLLRAHAISFKPSKYQI